MRDLGFFGPEKSSKFQVLSFGFSNTGRPLCGEVRNLNCWFSGEPTLYFPANSDIINGHVSYLFLFKKNKKIKKSSG